MMLIFVRIPLTLLYIYSIYWASVSETAYSGPQMVGLTLYVLLGGIVMAALWAPVIGAKLSDPLTSALTQETSLPADPNRLVEVTDRLKATSAACDTFRTLRTADSGEALRGIVYVPGD